MLIRLSKHQAQGSNLCLTLGIYHGIVLHKFRAYLTGATREMARAHHAQRPLAASPTPPGHEMADLWYDERPVADSIDIPRLFLFLRRNVRRIAATALIVAGLVLGLGFLIFNKYAATALILFNPHTAHVTQSADVLPGIGSDAIAIESLVQVARANTFLGRVVDRFDLTADPEFSGTGSNEATRRAATINNLKKHLMIERRGATYLVDVTMSTHDAQKSAKLANGVAKMIVDDQAAQRRQVTDRADAWLTTQLAALRDQVSKASKAAAALKAKLKITDAGQGVTLQEKRITELNQQRVLASVATSQARSRLDQFIAAKGTGADRLPSSLQSLTLAALRQNYALLSRELADRATVLGVRHPEVLSLEAQIAEAKRQINAEIERLINAARADYRANQQKEASIVGELRQAQAESGALGQRDVRLQALDREAKADRVLYDQLLARQKEVSELQTLDSSDVRIVSPALAPIHTNRPPALILLAASCFLGLFSGLGFAFGAETLRRSVRSASEAERLIGAPVVGILPLTREAPPRRDGVFPRREVARWLSDVCAFALNEGVQRNGRTLLVASARRGEGRSTIAANLAACIARGGDMVLLIEASPGEGAADSRLGLLDVLRRGESLPRALVDIGDSGVTVLPIGRRGAGDPAEVSALMRRSKLRDIIHECQRWFDVIVIDGPPVLGAGYASVLASVADLSIFAVEWNATDPALVREAMERLGPVEKVLVLNKVDLARYALFDPSFSARMKEREFPPSIR